MLMSISQIKMKLKLIKLIHQMFYIMLDKLQSKHLSGLAMKSQDKLDTF